MLRILGSVMERLKAALYLRAFGRIQADLAEDMLDHQARLHQKAAAYDESGEHALAQRLRAVAAQLGGGTHLDGLEAEMIRICALPMLAETELHPPALPEPILPEPPSAEPVASRGPGRPRKTGDTVRRTEGQS